MSRACADPERSSSAVVVFRPEMSADIGRLDMIRQRIEAIKNKKEDTVMGGGKAAYLKEEDRETLKIIVQNHFNNPGYSDEMVAKKVNDGDLLKLDGAHISAGHVAKMRKELGLRKKSKGGRRSMKTRETEDEAPPVTAARRKASVKPVKKGASEGLNVTLADLLEAAGELVGLVQRYTQQERDRVGI